MVSPGPLGTGRTSREGLATFLLSPKASEKPCRDILPFSFDISGLSKRSACSSVAGFHCAVANVVWHVIKSPIRIAFMGGLTFWRTSAGRQRSSKISIRVIELL